MALSELLRYGSNKGLVTDYRYGTKKWDDYLLDIRYAVEKQGATISSQIRSSEILYAKQVEGQRATVEALAAINSDLSWGLQLIADSLSSTNTLLENIRSLLSHIAGILQSPTETRALELCKRGYAMLGKGWVQEAADDLHKSEELSRANPATHLALGKIYFYGKVQADEIGDLAAAERHFKLASKYAQGYESDSPSAVTIFNDARYELSRLLYVHSSELSLAKQASTARERLQECSRTLNSSMELRSRYLLAKVQARLGAREEAYDLLRGCADINRDYLRSATSDEDFRELADSIENLDKELRNDANSQTGKLVRLIQSAHEDIANAKQQISLQQPSLSDYPLQFRNLIRRIEELEDFKSVRLLSESRKKAESLKRDTERLVSELKAEPAKRARAAFDARVQELQREASSHTVSARPKSPISDFVAMLISGLTSFFVWNSFGSNNSLMNSELGAVISVIGILPTVLAVIFAFRFLSSFTKSRRVHTEHAKAERIRWEITNLKQCSKCGYPVESGGVCQNCLADPAKTAAGHNKTRLEPTNDLSPNAGGQFRDYNARCGVCAHEIPVDQLCKACEQEIRKNNLRT